MGSEMCIRDRIVTVPEPDYTVPVVCFNSCEACTATSIKDVVAANSLFTVSPIPTSDLLNIDFTTGINGETTILLYNIAGQMIKQEILQNSTNHQLAVQNLPEGVYVLSVINQDRIATRKVLIQR